MLRTLYFWRSSFDNGEDMILRRMWEGALKCLLLFFLREEETALLNFILLWRSEKQKYFSNFLFSMQSSTHAQIPLPGYNIDSPALARIISHAQYYSFFEDTKRLHYK